MINITPTMHKRATERNEHYYKRWGTAETVLKSQIGKTRMTGFLGEEIVRKAFPALKPIEDTPNHDLTYGDMKIEVKASTGLNTYVMEYQRHRDIDYFVFVLVNRDHKQGSIKGLISKDDFFRQAELFPRGTRLENFFCRNNQYHIDNELLTIPKDLETFFERKSK